MDYLIWDWNGTLLDDVNAAVNALNRMLAMRNVKPTTREYYREHFGFPVRPFYAELGVDLEHEDWDRICVDFHRFIAAEPDQRLRPDAIEALSLARAHGLGQSILSALREDILRRDTARLGVSAFFEEIYGVDNLDGATKLSRGRDLFERLFPASEPTSRTVDKYFIGDTLHDAEVARALGAKCILVDGGHQTASRLAATGAFVAPNLVAAVTHVLAVRSKQMVTQ